MYIVFSGFNGDTSAVGLDTFMGLYPTLEEAVSYIESGKDDMGGRDWYHLGKIVDGKLFHVTVDGEKEMITWRTNEYGDIIDRDGNPIYG